MNKETTEFALAVLCEIAQQSIYLETFLKSDGCNDEKLVAMAKQQAFDHISEFISDLLKKQLGASTNS